MAQSAPTSAAWTCAFVALSNAEEDSLERVEVGGLPLLKLVSMDTAPRLFLAVD